MSKTIKNLLVGLFGGFMVMALFGYWIWENKEAKGFVGNELPIQFKDSHNATSTYTSDNDEDNDGGYLTSTSTFWLTGQVAIWDTTISDPYPYVATATTEWYNISNASVFTVGVQMLASSTASSISFDAEISRDGSNWYEFIPTAVANPSGGNIDTGFLVASTTLFTYNPSSDGGGTDNDTPTSTPSFSLDLRNTAAKYLRLKVGGSIASSTVRLQTMWR